MNEIKLYIEFHWGKRRPNLNYFLNGQELTVSSLEVVETRLNQENIVLTLHSDFQHQNLFEIKMSDKTDNDLVMNGDGFIDHWVKIRQLELDQIKLDYLMYRACSFSHSMSDEWIANMASQGHEILPCYPTGTDMRLNGTWSINFDLPIWEWCVRSY
jgi:hypothetical protein